MLPFPGSRSELTTMISPTTRALCECDHGCEHMIWDTIFGFRGSEMSRMDAPSGHLMADECGGALNYDLAAAGQLHPAEVADVRETARRGSGVGISGRQHVSRGDIHGASPMARRKLPPRGTASNGRRELRAGRDYAGYGRVADRW